MARELDASQRDAVTADVGDLRVFAGAGAGKTRVLTERARLLSDQCRAQHGGRVGVFTFTRDAAGELLERLEDAGGCVEASTLHSLGLRVLRSGKDYRRIVSEWEVEPILRAVNKRHFLGYDLDDEDDRQRMRGDISRVRRTLHGGEWEWIEDYLAQLRAAERLDFDDLILLPLALRPQTLARYGRRFAHVLVDEAQDLTPAEWDFLEVLTPRSATISMVGDPCQSIYGFRGAMADAFLGRAFQDRDHEAQCTLGYNYRSGQRLVGLGNDISEDLAKVPRTTEAVREVPGDIALTTCDTHRAAEETLWQARHAAERWQVPVQVLARTRREVRLLERVWREWQQADVTGQVAVHVSTMHAAKGREWPVVVLHGMAGGTFPSPYGEVAEEHRLFYVAATRAADVLLVPSTTSWGYQTPGHYWSWLQERGYGATGDDGAAAGDACGARD